MDLHTFTFPLMGMENGGLAITFYTAISQSQYTLADAHHVHCNCSSWTIVLPTDTHYGIIISDTGIADLHLSQLYDDTIHIHNKFHFIKA